MKRQGPAIAAGVVFLLGCFSWSFAQSPDEDALRTRMKMAMDALDSSKSLAAVPWDEYVALLYARLQGREPTLREFAALRGLRRSVGLKPSEALSLVLRGEEDCPTYAQIRVFLESKDAGAFASTAQSRAVARDLAAAYYAHDWTQEAEVGEPMGEASVSEPDPPNVPYHVYYGYIHAHSRLSDGEGTPLEAYTQARDSGMDFFSLTDHGELLMLWPWENKYTQLREAADATNEPGRFAALFGFEWTNPLLGHINVINANQFTDVLQNFALSSFYCWLEAHPEAFGRFNHPGWSDEAHLEFLHGRLFPKAAPQMVGIELWNGGASFDFFYYGGSWTNDFSFIDAMNRQGWRLGALGDGDNHTRDWGQGNYRTGVLAEELTREAVVDAYRHRRFYSTEDKDLILDFRCGGYPMGSIVSGTPREFRVTASDGSGDTFQEVRLYRNGELLETRAVEGNVVDVVFTDTSGSGDAYYYVIVRQNDDDDMNGRNDEAISSPIWLGEPLPLDPPPLGCAGVRASGTAVNTKLRCDMLILLVVPCVLYMHVLRSPKGPHQKDRQEEEQS